MAENPLLPDAELRALHTLLQTASRVEATETRRRARNAPRPNSAALCSGREALLAGTLLQLRPGDLLVTGSGDASSRSILTSLKQVSGQGPGIPDLPPGAAQLMSASAMSAALKAAGGGGLVLAHTHAGRNDDAWPEALAWAQLQQLPLILACADPSGPRAFQPTFRDRPGFLHWAALTKIALRLGLPVLSVDGEDAVAVYRVMQESVLRARAGGGPAVLWAMLPGPAKLSRGKRTPSSTPLGRLRRYLRTRKIGL